MEINDKVIILTGASSGIGLQTAKSLSAAGAKVVLAARASDKLTSAEKEIKNSFAVPTDVRKDSDLENLVNKTIEKFGRIDILINGAARGMFSIVENIDPDKYRELIELNVIAPLSLMKKVIPIMRKQGGGTILNISSLSSKRYIPNIAGYASTKYALNAISLTAREELAKDNIKVSIICPYIVNSDFGKNSIVPEPEALRYNPDGSVLPSVLTTQKVAEEIIKLIKSGEAEAIIPPAA